MTARRHRPFGFGVAPTVAALLALLVGACGPGPTGQPNGSPTGSPGGSSPSAGPGESLPVPSPDLPTVRAYFMLGSFTGDGGLVPVLRAASSTTDLGAEAMAALLAGPTEAELGAQPAMYSAIPDDTRVIDVTVAGNVATVTLSSPLLSASADPTARQGIAQIVYTLTQFPGVTSVVVVDQGATGPAPSWVPATRDQFHDLVPPVWVDEPTWGGALPSGATVSGLANVFEAQFQLQVLDAGGQAIVDLPVSASCGTGCWGTFGATVTYAVTSAQWGTLRVFEPSAKDGSPTHTVDYPVWLTP